MKSHCSQHRHLEKKNAFHKKYVAVFKALAKLLGLPKGSFRVESNKGGHAVSGEVIFHTPYAYAQVCGFSSGAFLVRACEGLKDFTGYENEYLPISYLDGDMKPALEKFRALKKQMEVVRVMRESKGEPFVHMCPKMEKSDGD
jgi:hypothetical protein